MNRLLRFCFLIYTLSVAATVGAQPVADFTMSDTAMCAPGSITFTDASSNVTASTTYNWTFGVGPAASGTGPYTKIYSTPGTYSVTLTLTDGTNTSTKTATVYMYGKPSITGFTASVTSGCVPLNNVQFNSSAAPNAPTGAPQGLTYAWDFGDGTTPANANQQNPVHNYTQAGGFNVVLTVTNAKGCPRDSTKSFFITVFDRPTPGFVTSPADYYCGIPAPFTFTNNSSGIGPFKAGWDFGDGSGRFTGSPVSHTYTAAGTYTVTLYDTDANGCTPVASAAYPNGTLQKQVTVYAKNPSFTISPTVGCVNGGITFTNTTPGASGATWDYGDGISDNLGSHAYTTAGTYQVRMISNTGSCLDTLVKTFLVNPLPVIKLTVSPAIPCPAPTTVTFTATSPGSSSNTTYSWNFGGPAFTGGGNGIVAYPFMSNGYKTIQITATDNNTTCSRDTTIFDFPIYPLVTELKAAPDSGCIPFTSTFNVDLKTTLPPPMGPGPLPNYPVGPDPTKFNWTFEAFKLPSTTSTQPSPSNKWDSVGTYKIWVTGESLNGCPFKDSTIVHADTPILTDFYATPLTLCPKQPTHFFNTSKNDPHTLYRWNLGDTSFTPNTWLGDFYHSYRLPGKYSVELLTNHIGCVKKKSLADYITVNPANAAFNYAISCGTYQVTFGDLSIGATSWTWDFGDGTGVLTGSAATPPVTHTYASTGNYNVHLHTNNNVYGCSDDTTIPVLIFDPVNALTFTATKDTFCVGENIRFIASFVGPTTTPTYSWIIDSDPPTPYSTQPFIDYVFTTRGAHTVKLMSNYGGICAATTQSSRFYAARPIVGFTASPVIGCIPLTVTLTDASTAIPGTTITNRDWNFGDGGRNTGGNPTTVNHTYVIPGIDTVHLTLTDNFGCQDSVIKNGFVEAHHTVAGFFTSNGTSPVCVHDSIAFTDAATGTVALNYTWDFGDGTFSNAQNPKHAYDKAGTYTVKQLVGDNVPCKDSFIKTVTVQGPTAGFTKDKTVGTCKTLQVHFTNTSVGATTYEWDMGDGVKLNTTPGVYTYSTPGRYIIRLKATDATPCTDYFQDTVYLLGYNGSFTYAPSNGCKGQTIQFKALVNNVPKVTWDFGDGFGGVTNKSDTFHTYNTPGTYHPVVIYSDASGCSAFDSGLVPIQIDEVRSDFSTSVPCIGVPFTLTQSSSALFDNPNSWIWLFSPSSDTATGPSASYQYNSSGNHSITLISTNSWGCTDTIVKNVFINPLPIIDAGPADTGICPGDTILLTGHGGATYEWSSPTAPISCSLCTTTRAWTAAPTTYYLKGTDSNGCINTDSITARIQIKTTAEVKPGGAVCIGETFRLQASGATIYHWSPAAFLDSPDISSPLARPIITTHYVVEAQEGTCLIHYDTVVVEVHPSPFFDAGHDQVINYGASVMLDPTRGGISRIEWRPDTTLSCLDCFDPVAHPLSSTLYYAKGYSEYGCVDSDSVFVRVRCNGDSVFIPNTFTPNGDGLNEVFYPRGKGIAYVSTFRIFNRWGELVFERSNFPLNDEANGWDGSYKGKQLSPDVYMYTISSRCANGEIIEWKGDVTLVR